MAEFPAIWEELVQEKTILAQFKDDTLVTLYTNYDGSSPFGEFDEQVGAEASLGVRIYYSYFLRGRISFKEFQLRIKGLAALKQISPSTAMDWIQREIGRKCWFFLVVDGIQKTFEGLETFYTLSFPGVLLTTLATLLHDEMKNEDYVVFPFAVGTHFGPIGRYMTGFRTMELKVPLLNEEARSLIVDSVLGRFREEGYNWRDDKKLERLLKVYGNFGRGLEAVLFKYTELHGQGQAFKDISALSVASYFQEKCAAQEVKMSAEEAKRLVRIWLLGEGVERTGRIPGTEVSADVLESRGYTQLQDIVVNDRTMSKMRLLANGLTLLQNSLKDSFPIFSCVVDSFLSLEIRPNQFEETIPYFLALRAALSEPTTLQDLFPGATFSPPALANFRFQVPVTTVNKGGHTFEVPAMTVNEGRHTFDDLKGIARGNVGQIYCTGNANQGFDFFFLLHTQAGEKQAFFINCKKVADSVSQDCCDPFTKTQAVLEKESEPWKNGIVGVITTGEVTLETSLEPPKLKEPKKADGPSQKKEDLQQKVFVIDAKGIRTFLGPFFEYL